MWQSPLPSISEMMARINDAKMSGEGGVYAMGPQYCAFAKEKSKSCDEFNVGNYDTNGIVYKRDQYWNKTATIPSQVSVLLMSGKLDPQTPNKYAESLLNTLNGENKELIVFDYASHGTIMTTQMVAGDPWSETCGMKVLASYVRNGGDLARLDKSCIDEMPAFNLTTPDSYLTNYFATDDAYDGVFNTSLVSSS
ncbi:Serine protease family S33 [Phytophthora palmivora]|uniref:Serine protease family S33 n=1 Tax=Phytophthora palmivora TaxID=4796 RepID=A0A2P4X067_9STRA|nr:Serine protease family S33 [Phytophthora palmivora]